MRVSLADEINLSGRYAEITLCDASETCQLLPDREFVYSPSALKWEMSGALLSSRTAAATCSPSRGALAKTSDVSSTSAEAVADSGPLQCAREQPPAAGSGCSALAASSSKQGAMTLAARFPRAQQALALAICLSDGLVNQFRDQNFESCPLCVCDNSVRGSPADTELYLPPVARCALRPEDAPQAGKHSCAFNALGLRSHACSAALFAEDIADILGALPAERSRAYQCGDASTAPRALALYDRSEPALCHCQPSSLFAGYVAAARDERSPAASSAAAAASESMRAQADWLVCEQTTLPAGVSLLARLLEPPSSSPFALQFLSALVDASVTQYLCSLLSWTHGRPAPELQPPPRALTHDSCSYSGTSFTSARASRFVLSIGSALRVLVSQYSVSAYAVHVRMCM